jgi:Tfp pilus assembly protein PilW
VEILNQQLELFPVVFDQSKEYFAQTCTCAAAEYRTRYGVCCHNPSRREEMTPEEVSREATEMLAATAVQMSDKLTRETRRRRQEQD